MQELKKILTSSLGRVPWTLVVSGLGLCFAYAMKAPTDELAVVGLLPGIAMFLLGRLSGLFIPHSSQAEKDEFEKAKKELGATGIALLTIASGAILFSVVALASALLYWAIGLHFIATAVLKVGLLALAFSLFALLSEVVSLLLGKAFNPNAMWCAVICMVIFFIALPSSATSHSADSPTHVKNI